MDLNQFFSESGASSMVDFAKRCGCNGDQMRQWRHGYDDRRPGPIKCVVIEAESGFKVRRWDLRPKDWHLIWPELIGVPGAPALGLIETHDTSLGVAVAPGHTNGNGAFV